MLTLDVRFTFTCPFLLLQVSFFFVRRSCSIDKCPLSPGALSLLSQKRDMVRSESLRVDSGDRTHRIFKPSDLIHGEVLGKGFFGQAVKVPHFPHLPLCSFRYFACLRCCFIHFKLTWHLPCCCQGNASGDRGGNGDEGVDKVRRRDAENFPKGGEWSSEGMVARSELQQVTLLV